MLVNVYVKFQTYFSFPCNTYDIHYMSVLVPKLQHVYRTCCKRWLRHTGMPWNENS